MCDQPGPASPWVQLCYQQPTVSGQTTPVTGRAFACLQEKCIILSGADGFSAYCVCVSVMSAISHSMDVPVFLCTQAT
jgi:hypothetical protein